MCIFGVGRGGVGDGEEGGWEDQTKGLSFIQTIRTDHFELARETGKSVLCRVR